MQNNYCKTTETLFSLDSVSVMYIVYCFGILLFFLNRPENWFLVAKIFATISAVSAIARLVVTGAQADLICLVVCWFALGFCGGFAIRLFVISLNNTERLFGVILVSITHGLWMVLEGFGAQGAFFAVILPTVLTVGIAICVYSGKKETEVFPVSVAQKKPLHPSIWLATGFFIWLFVMDSASTFVFSDQSPVALRINGFGVFVAILLAYIIQMVYKQSVWHMWNLFFILSFLCHLLPVVSNSVFLYHLASFMHGMLYVGYIAMFYTIGGIYKKHGSVSLLRKNIFIMFGIIAGSLIGLGYLEHVWSDIIWIVIAVGSAASCFLFVILAPLFQRHFFGADWMEDFQKLDMSDREDDKEKETAWLNSYKLSPREKEVAVLLLQGLTMRQISACIGISYHTVNTHCKSLYKKLGVNSRTEIFAQHRVRIPWKI